MYPRIFLGHCNHDLRYHSIWSTAHVTIGAVTDGDMSPVSTKLSRTERIVSPPLMTSLIVCGESSCVNTFGNRWEWLLDSSILMFYGVLKNPKRRARYEFNDWIELLLNCILVRNWLIKSPTCQITDGRAQNFNSNFALAIRWNNDKNLFWIC